MTAGWSYTTFEVIELSLALYAIFLLIVFFILVCKSHSHYVNYDKFTVPKLIVGIFIFCTCLSGIYIYEKRDDALLRNIESGYIIYINGIEVDADTIDINEYSNIKVDDKNQYIIITVE